MQRACIHLIFSCFYLSGISGIPRCNIILFLAGAQVTSVAMKQDFSNAENTCLGASSSYICKEGVSKYVIVAPRTPDDDRVNPPRLNKCSDNDCDNVITSSSHMMCHVCPHFTGCCC